MNFKDMAAKILGESVEKKDVKEIVEEVVINEELDVKIEVPTERVVTEKSELNFVGSFNYVPDPIEYNEGSIYKNVNEGVAYIRKGLLWEELVRDGKPGRDAARVGGSGVGVAEVKSITGMLGIFDSKAELDKVDTSNLKIGTIATLPSGPVTWRGASAGGWVAETSAAQFIVSLYDAQDAIDSVVGDMNAPRATLPIANDIPELTASQTAPSADVDPCNRVLKIMGPTTDLNDFGIIPFSARSNKEFLRGHNQNVCSRNGASDYLVMYRGVSYTTNTLNKDSDGLIEPGSIWVLSAARPILDFYLDGDVVIFRHNGVAGNGDFCLWVNGSMISSDPGAGVYKAASGVSYNLGTGSPSTAYFKMKFPTAEKRRITIKTQATNVPVRIYTRNISQISPVVERPPVWLHFGCSFSDFTISDSGNKIAQFAMSEWMHSKFGFKCDFINMAIGGTSLTGAAGNQILPSMQQPYATGKSASQRKALLQQSQGLNADVITFLAGHNDATAYANPLLVSELTSWIADARRMHPNAKILILGTDASPGIITGGLDVQVENVLASVCAANGVDFAKLQTSTVPTMTGSGKQGSETGVGNTDVYTGPDGTHPTIKGHRMYGKLMARLVRNWLAGLKTNA